MKKIFIILIFCIPLSVLSQEQTVNNPNSRSAESNLPDISVIGDITNSLSVHHDFYSNDLSVREVEFAFQGYIAPEARADIFFAMHMHEGSLAAEICEGYVTFLNVVDGLNLKAGKIHIDFGKINKVHQHERPYVDSPLVLTNFFGEHGLVGEGAVLGYLLPLPVFVQIDLGAWRVAGHTHEAGSSCGNDFSLANIVYTGRLWSSFSTGETSELELGGSVAAGNGAHYLEHQDEAKVYGLDLTFKLWPSSFERLIFQNEYLYLVRLVPVGELKRGGFYSYLGYRFNKNFEAGLRYDYTENAFPENETLSKTSCILTNNLTEMTKLRLQYGYNNEANSHEVSLQLVFGVGPHSHPLQ